MVLSVSITLMIDAPAMMAAFSGVQPATISNAGIRAIPARKVRRPFFPAFAMAIPGIRGGICSLPRTPIIGDEALTFG